MIEATRAELPELQTFVVQLGAAMNSAGEPVYSVQDRLRRVTAAYGAKSARISAFPTFMMVSMGRGEPATLELTAPLTGPPRLDQIAALERLVTSAEHAEIHPADGLHELDEITAMSPRFGPLQSILGYSVLTLGICLILHPALRDVVAAAAFGALVGALRSMARGRPALQVLMPVIAAFAVSALSAAEVRAGWDNAGLRAMVASLVVFLPGAALTTAVLELAAGQMVSGASRLVSGVLQLALLAFGIVAGIEAVGVNTEKVFSSTAPLLGPWAPWLGVLIYASGLMVANSAPPRSFPTLLAVLYAAWVGQVIGNELFGGYVSALVGAAVMTPVAYWVSRLPSAMPQYASFLPGFWLLVPGALGLIGLTELASGAARTQDAVATVVSIFAVAIGVLCGTVFASWVSATGRAFGELSETLATHNPWLRNGRKKPPDVGLSESQTTPP